MTSKSKFSQFQQSYGDTTGAADGTGPDNGRDKIDYDKVVATIAASDLTADFTNQMTAHPFNYVFFHYQDPDATGHASGWSTDPASDYATTLKEVDTQIGLILQMVETVPALQGKTTVILTAGGDLYALNPVSRKAPGASVNPSYTGGQPVRNGEAANLALDLLGLGAVPVSMINSGQDLQVAVAPVITAFSNPGVGLFAMSGSSDGAGELVVEMATNLGSQPIPWRPIQTNLVPAGPFLFSLPPVTNSQAFFRVIRQ